MGVPVSPGGNAPRGFSTISVASPAARFSPGFGSSVRHSSWMKSAASALPIQRLWPVTTYSSPSSSARVLTAARSEPASGSEKPAAPIHSPRALRRSSVARVASSAKSVPSPWARAMMLATLIQATASSSATIAYSNTPSPSPPYSVGIISPKKPSRPMASMSSRGISFFCGSYSSATGRTWSVAKRRARCCRASRSSVAHGPASTGGGAGCGAASGRSRGHGCSMPAAGGEDSPP